MDNKRSKNISENSIAHFHLPGLFEFYEFYKVFLPIYTDYKEYFYEWVDISSIYGAPKDAIWGGGRIGDNDSKSAEEILHFLEKYNISSRLAFSNSLINNSHLSDITCNSLCHLFNDSKINNGIIIYSDLLLSYLKSNYPNLYFVSSTTKVLTDFEDFYNELNREEFKYIVPDFRLNKKPSLFNSLNSFEKNKVEFLCNECCYIGCNKRKECYEAVSHIILDDKNTSFTCVAPYAEKEYSFSKAMANPSFIGIEEIKNIYLSAGFSNFKIEGRGLGTALLLEFILYYMVKPKFHINIREKIYLNNMLDLF